MPTDERIDEGDNVFVGSGAVHWVVEHIDLATDSATLRSGMTNRTRREPLANLSLHSKGPTPAMTTTTAPEGFQPNEPIIYQNTLKAKILRRLENGNYIIAFGHATKVATPFELRRGEPETVEKL